MAEDKKKHVQGSVPVENANQAPAPTGGGGTPEERTAVALEACAEALTRLANKFAPLASVQSFASGARLPTCPEGHRMQPTDSYCQVCEPGTPKPPRAPRAA